MDRPASVSQKAVLLAGDIIVLVLVTVFGFATHGEAGSAGARMLTTFVPLVMAWLLVFPHLGAWDVSPAAELRQVWRPFWAMVLAGPLAAFLRGLLLNNRPILPIFVIVLGGISALAILAWRLLFVLIISRKK